MVDITQKPYHSYNEAIEQLSIDIKSKGDVRFIGYNRAFPNRERFMICTEKDWNIDFYTVRQLYRYGVYEKPIHELVSGFNMWDHLPYAPQEVYGHTRSFGIDHGLTILRQQGDYCDSFIFASQPGNSLINNFYLNQKELFLDFINHFYTQMKETIEELGKHRIKLPDIINVKPNPFPRLSSRQKECARLLTEGFSAKEIAQKLLLSPRTVECHIDALREKFNAKNRVQLIHSIKNI